VKKRGVFKLKKKNQWQPLTERSKDSGDYIVYRGYCIQSECFTLDQAKILLGEIGPSQSIEKSLTREGTNDHEAGAYNGGIKKEPKTIARLWKGWKKEGNGSSSGSNNPSPLVFSNQFAGFSAGSRNNSYDVGRRSTKGKDETIIDQSCKLSSEIRRDDDDVSVGSAMTSGSKVRASLKQLLEDDVGTVLDLSLTRLHHVHISELVQALQVASSLETLILENCRLNDNEIEILANGLASDESKATMLARLSFRSNRIGNRGAVSLRPFFTATSSLEEIDLSKNQIGSRGANYTFHAFRDNPRVKIKMINLSQNEIWDVDGDGGFFSTNNTLQLLNLEGNYIHDEGIELMANGLYKNGGDTQLEELNLGWNGIGDEGCIQIGQMLETNSSLVKIGLGENDITSVGAKALLVALRSNDTLREIRGLSHNQIDRSFITNSIKLLLSSRIDAFVSEEDAQFRLEEMMESSLNGTDAPGQSDWIHLPTPEEISESSLDWADKLYAPGEDAKPPIAEISAPGVLLGETTALENSTTKLEIPNSASIGEDVPDTDDHRNNRNDSSSSLKFQMDRLSVIQAAPLTSLDPISNLHHPVPLRDYDHEKHVIEQAVEGASKLNATIELDVVTGTVENFMSFFHGGTGRVLHFSGFGHQKQSFALENNSGMLDDCINFESLKELVQSAKLPIQLVVVNSFYSGRIGKAFVDAGVPHVICCHHTEIFRDKACYSFLKNLYRGLALNKTIKEAFHDSQEAVRVEEITKHIERYVLLPRRPEADSYHDVPIFYTSPVPPTGMVLAVGKDTFDTDKTLLPEISKHFIGRELDMYHILEALRMDNLVQVGGTKGMGKSATMAAVCQYINHRKPCFCFDSVLWLPPGKGIVPSPDTLFGDLSFLFAEMTKPNHDILTNEFAMEIKERIMLELEEQSTLLAIDSHQFAGETLTNLEFFIEELLRSNINVKIILTSEYMTEDESDENVTLGPIDFKSTALLFGEISRFVTANGCPAAQSPDEFASLMVPPSVVLSRDKSNLASSRQARLMTQIGSGIPMEILRAAKSMPASVFIHLIGMANTPEIFVDSHSSLDAAMRKWSQFLEKAVTSKNFLRAMDLEYTMRELHRFKKQFPTIDELLAQEQELHRRHTACFKNRQYEEGNRLKRDIIALKKRILQEKRSATSASTRKNVTADGMNDLQEQVDSIMKLANSSFSSEIELPYQEKYEAAFILGSGYHNCALHIYSGQAYNFDPQNNDLGAVVCWTNECCDLTSDTYGQMLIEYGGANLSKDVTSLPGITKTPWGVAKCGTGNAVIVGPGSYGRLRVCCVIFAVGPMSAAGVDRIKAEDKDELHYIKVMMRSCIRSSMILAKHSQVQSIAFPTLSPEKDCTAYDHILMMQLKLLVDEANHSDLITLHIVAESEVEASKLVGMAQELGLVKMG